LTSVRKEEKEVDDFSSQELRKKWLAPAWVLPHVLSSKSLRTSRKLTKNN
jgi:hypothetical protein